MRYKDFPSQIYIENTNKCNSHCIMCPREKHVRKQGVMGYALYEKLIQEIARFKKEVERVHLHNYGEPLLDKEFLRKIKPAKSSGIKHVYFVTNASLLTEKISCELVGSGADEFKISFNGTDPLTYNSTMQGLDFDRTLQNILNFIRIRREAGSQRPRIIIQYIPQGSNGARSAEFKKLFHKVIDASAGDSLMVVSLHNYGGGKTYCSLRRDDRRVCPFPWEIMMILWDGRVSTCCMDYNGIQILGGCFEGSVTTALE